MNKVWLVLFLALIPASAYPVSGKVALGVTNPVGKMHVGGQTSNLAHFESLSAIPDSVTATMQVSEAMSGTHYGLYITSKGSGVNTAIFASASGSGTNFAAVFPAGLWGIGTTGPSYPLQVTGTNATYTIFAYGSAPAAIVGSTTIGTSAGAGVMGVAGSYYGYMGRADGYAFVGSGAVWATGASYFNQSDGRLKEHVENLKRPLEIVKKLRPVSYQWKPGSEAFKTSGTARQFGLIAQEVKDVIPGVVIFNKKSPLLPNENEKATLDQKNGGSYGVEYGKIIPFLIGSVQEVWSQLQAFVADQKKFNVSLGQQLGLLEEEAQQLEAEYSALKDIYCQGNITAKFCAGKR